MQRKKHTAPMKSGDEYDAFFKAPLCVFNNWTGIRKKTKKAYNKRQRKAEKAEPNNIITEIYNE